MQDRSTTLAIDFGSKYIGVALVAHCANVANRVPYAATIIVEPRPLKELVTPRAQTRRLRRTRKTHQRRLRRLAQSLAGTPNVEAILRFCRRRGFGHDPSAEQEEQTFHIPRDQFFQALEAEVERLIPPEFRQRVVAACERHLNRKRRQSAELRPARFENRGRSRCNWAGCHHNVPRAGHDFKGRLQQSLFLWLQPVFQESKEPDRLRRSVEHWIDELAALAQAYRRSSPDGERRKAINRRVRAVYERLRSRMRREASERTAEQFEANWSEHYRPILSEIVHGEAAGRVRYCREHSAMFVDYAMRGAAIPNREDIRENDLISRTQQIVFQRLWRLVQGRLLPLAGGSIDRVVVEHVAFDILSGPIKARQNLSEAKATEIYWYGPQAGFGSRWEMLKTEFAGRCAYCGQENASQIEHVFHQSDFPFDSYFNVVPACANCNAQKGGRTLFDAGLTIHDDTYAAYCEYLKAKKVLHPYHTIKKGLLNLLRRTATVGRAQQMIGMIADNLVSITATQRGPRPLARYLATKLAEQTGTRPRIEFRAARHTALYRGLILPGYDKEEAKAVEDLRNHAVDAIILGCRLPSASALENRQWRTSREDVVRWQLAVREAAPALADGLPVVESVEVVPYFEEPAGANYFNIDLSAFNWNRRRKAAHKTDPFGKTKDGKPVKRIPAANVLARLLKGGTDRQQQIEIIAHRRLREALRAAGEQAGEVLVQWLQKTVAAGLANGSMSSHPADGERRRLLEEFVAAPVTDIVGDLSGTKIPWTIGVRCLNRDSGSVSKVNVARRAAGKDDAQFYQAEAVWKEIRVGYREAGGRLDRDHPIVLAVSQIDALSRLTGQRWQSAAPTTDSPLAGRPLGSPGSFGEFRRRWEEAFAAFCREQGIVKVFRITQGCVIEKTDGSQFQIRNFDKSQPWMKGRPFSQIRRIHRSPFRVMGGPASGDES